MFQEFAKATAIVAAGMVGIVSIGNALGRVFWASVSDLLGRRSTFVVMFLLQIGLFWFLPSLHAVGVVTVVSFIILIVLRRRFRHHAGLRCRLLRPCQCGFDLWTDADRRGASPAPSGRC